MVWPELRELRKKNKLKIPQKLSHELHAQITCPKPLSGVFFLKLICKSKFEWWSQSWLQHVQHLQTAHTFAPTCCSLGTRSLSLNWNAAIVSLYMWLLHLRLWKAPARQFSNYTQIFYRDFICWRIQISEGNRKTEIAF